MVGDECYNWFVIKATRMITTSRKVFFVTNIHYINTAFFLLLLFSLSIYI